MTPTPDRHRALGAELAASATRWGWGDDHIIAYSYLDAADDDVIAVPHPTRDAAYRDLCAQLALYRPAEPVRAWWLHAGAVVHQATGPAAQVWAAARDWHRPPEGRAPWLSGPSGGRITTAAVHLVCGTLAAAALVSAAVLTLGPLLLT